MLGLGKEMTKRNPIKGMPPPKEMYLLAKARSNKILEKIITKGDTLPEVKVTGKTLEKIKVVDKLYVFMVKWVLDVKNLPTWFKHGERAHVTWDQVKELYDTGNNVMIRHTDSGSEFDAALYVDNKGFTQR